MSVCTSGCLTQDHTSYGECLRSKSAGVGVITPSAEYQGRKKWWTEIKEYRDARAQGIQPKSTQLADIRGAVSRSRAADKPMQES